MAARNPGCQHGPVPILTFRRGAPGPRSPDPSAQERELAYLVLVRGLAAANVVLGLAVLVLCHQESGWRAAVLLLCGGLLCAIGGWLAGVNWLRRHWRSRMQQQMDLWRGVVDTVTGWEEAVDISPDAALKLKHRLDRLVSRF